MLATNLRRLSARSTVMLRLTGPRTQTLFRHPVLGVTNSRYFSKKEDDDEEKGFGKFFKRKQKKTEEKQDEKAQDDENLTE